MILEGGKWVLLVLLGKGAVFYPIPLTERKPMCQWMVYILKCCDGSFYTGISNDLAKRLLDHEAGTGAKYTRGRGPFVVVYTEPHEGRSEASKREFLIKKLTRCQKEALIREEVSI